MQERRMPIYVIVLGLVSLGFLAGALHFARAELRFRARAASAPGTVVELAREPAKTGAVFRPVVEFVDGEGRAVRFAASVASSPPDYEVGEAVTVRFVPGNPRSAQIASFVESWIGTVVFGVLGVLVALATVLFGAADVYSRSRQAWLETHGTPVQAEVVGVERAGRAWKIRAQWRNPADGTVHAFQSDSLTFDPSPHLIRRVIEVRINPTDPSEYRVERGSLPNPT